MEAGAVVSDGRGVLRPRVQRHLPPDLFQLEVQRCPRTAEALRDVQLRQP